MSKNKKTEDSPLSTAQKKQRCVDVYAETRGYVSRISKAAGINRATFDRWYKGDAKFRAQIDEQHENLIDKYEIRLDTVIANGNWKALIKWLEAKAKHRGWGVRVNHNMNAEIDLSSLTDEQLQRLANGEALESVIGTNKGGRRA